MEPLNTLTKTGNLSATISRTLRSGSKATRSFESSARINGEVEALQKLHEHTPPPNEPIKIKQADFPKSRPNEPALRQVGFFDRLFGKRAEIESENEQRQKTYAASLAEWKAEKSAFEESERENAAQFDLALRTDIETMQIVLKNSLQDIAWPRETLVSFEITDAGRQVALDVDLPELEDMPTKISSVPERGLKLSVKQIKPKQLNEIYSRLVHGIGFRIIGEVFAVLPTAEKVTLSAFTQRDSPATGERTDTYIYSVAIDRPEWSRINFNKLSAVDVVEALNAFTMIRKIGRTGVFEPIVPINAG